MRFLCNPPERSPWIVGNDSPSWMKVHHTSSTLRVSAVRNRRKTPQALRDGLFIPLFMGTRVWSIYGLDMAWWLSPMMMKQTGGLWHLPVFLFPWPQKQQTMMNINFLLGLHVQFSKLPGYYGPTKTTNLSNCSAPITSSTKCHKTADTIQHDPPSVPRIYEYMIYSIYFKSMMYGCFLQHIDGAPKFYIKTKWRITFICMPAKNQRTYIYIYTHTVCMIHPKKMSHFYWISPTRNTPWSTAFQRINLWKGWERSHIPGLQSQAGRFHG